MEFGVVLLFLFALSFQESQGSACCENGLIRLVDGDTQYEGRVEICVDNEWGTVCDDNWKVTASSVVCRQLGYNDTGATSYLYSEGSGPIHLDEVSCQGNEERLLDCSHEDTHDCIHAEDITVRCACNTGAVRLVNGPGPAAGRVEVCQGGTWGTVCDDQWDNVDAGVVCRQLGYSRFNALGFHDAIYHEGTGEIYMDEVSCSGSEARLEDCPHNTDHDCSHAEDASAVCYTILVCNDGDLRLNGSHSGVRHFGEGRVEVCYNEVWGTVCDVLWNANDAQVVCRQLGFPTEGATHFTDAHFGSAPSSSPILLSSLQCNGTENRLSDCEHLGLGQTASTCTHSDDAGVRCNTSNSAPIRLAGGVSSYEGRVEVFLNGEWGTVCDDLWNVSEAMVACRQLGILNPSFTPQTFESTMFGEGTGPVHLDDVQCEGTEANLTSCSYVGSDMVDCFHHLEDVGLRCSQCTENSIRLQNGSSPLEGRVEVCLGGTWGTVCDDGWSTFDAVVTCRQLGMQLGVSLQGGTPLDLAFFGQGTGLPIAMANVACTSSEATLTDCFYCNANELLSCTHEEDAGVICLPPPIGPPASLYTSGVKARAFNLTWELPPLNQRIGWVITGFELNCTNRDGYGTWRTQLNSNSSLSIQRSDVEEYTEYTCCVAAVSSDTVGEGRCVTVTTSEAVPSGPPSDITITSTTYNSVTMAISQPLPQDRNGIITGYSIRFIQVSNDLLTSYETTLVDQPFTATNLLPYTTYSYTVAAKTVNGTGPMSNTSSVTTAEEAAPSAPPQNLTAESLNFTTVLLRWAPPEGEDQNGIIRSYNVTVTEVVNSTLSLVERLETIDTEQIFISNLQPSTNYSFSVAAYTIATGPFSPSLLVATQEDACSIVTVIVRLVNGPHPTAGRVEVCQGGTWGTVCDDDWDDIDAGVVCRQLGYSRFNAVGIPLARYGHGTGPIHMSAVNCSGSEARLVDCPHITNHNCEHTADASIECNDTLACNDGDLRLNGNHSGVRNDGEGRVEICLNETWGTVCDLFWSTTDAQVACRQLEFPTTNATSYINGYFGSAPSSSPIVLSSLQCSGSESRLVDCQHLGFGQAAPTCRHSDDAGVRCFTTPIGPPASLHTSGVEAQAFNLTWKLPPPNQRIEWVITGFELNCTNMDGYGPWSTQLDGNSSLSIQRSDVEEYTEYTCCVAAVSSSGVVGEGRCVTVTTSEAVPSGPPSNITITSTTHNSVTMTISQPLPQDKNGIITGYSIRFIQVSNGFITSYETALVDQPFTATNLLPYTTYWFTVAANTVNGMGPESNTFSVTTDEAAPSAPPQSLTAESLNFTTILLRWAPPEEEDRNGIIRSYNVTVTEVVNSTLSLVERLETIDTEQIFISDLRPFTNYSFAVAAYTTATGPFSPSLLVTTQGDVPSIVPTLGEITRISATEIQITWNVPEGESEIDTYFVRYRPLLELVHRKRNVEDTAVVIETSQTMFRLTGLDPGSSYAVSVAAGNRAGRGHFSMEVTSELFASSDFILHLSGAILCRPWLDHNGDRKLSAILNHTASELMNDCSCSLSASYLAYADLSCDDNSTDRVILRAALVGTQERHGAELHNLLQQWVNEGQWIVIQGFHLEVVTCSTYPGFEATCSTFNTPVTTLNTPVIDKESESSSANGAPIYAGLFGGVVVLFVAVVVVLVAVVYKRQKSKTYSTNLKTRNASLNGGISNPISSSVKDSKLCEIRFDNEAEHIYDDPDLLIKPHDEPNTQTNSAYGHTQVVPALALQPPPVKNKVRPKIEDEQLYELDVPTLHSLQEEKEKVIKEDADQTDDDYIGEMPEEKVYFKLLEKNKTQEGAYQKVSAITTPSDNNASQAVEKMVMKKSASKPQADSEQTDTKHLNKQLAKESTPESDYEDVSADSDASQPGENDYEVMNSPVSVTMHMT